MSESEEKPFTVKDRRKFTPEGRVRDETGAGGGPEAPAPGPAAAGTAGATVDDDVAREAVAAPAGANARTASPPSPAGPVDFSRFLLSLGAQAGALLSGAGAEDGMSGEDAVAHAQSIVSILEMLEDKTRGRRTEDEDRLLEELLFELRMAYVQKKRAGAL